MIYEAWRISYQSSEQAARAAYAECVRLQAKIEQMEIGKREIRAAHNVAKRRLSALADENITLKVKIAEMERQKPVAEWTENRFDQYPQLVWNEKYRATIGAKLYALPGAAPSEHDMPSPASRDRR